MASKALDRVAKKRGRPAQTVRPEGPRRIILQATPEFEAWLDRRAAQLRTTRSGAIDRMLAEWAETHDTEPPPPRL